MGAMVVTMLCGFNIWFFIVHVIGVIGSILWWISRKRYFLNLPVQSYYRVNKAGWENVVFTEELVVSCGGLTYEWKLLESHFSIWGAYRKIAEKLGVTEAQFNALYRDSVEVVDE
jgi:hypothetical protein